MSQAGPSSSTAKASSSQDRKQRNTSASSSQPSKRMSQASGGKDEPKMIGQWRIGRTIGKGSSGRVKIAKHAITNKYAAIKIVPKGLILTSRMSMSEAGARADKVLLGIEREIVIMKLIDHPNVLNLYDVWETSGELYLIMEYVPGGELFDYLVKRGRLPLSEALHYFQQIIHAVDYCHRFNICHRDLKPENLLLDKDKNIKVADFGMAAWEAGERMLETSCGSPHYASPEIVAGRAYHGSSSDIWSCGIILFALITGRLPFDDDNIRLLLLKVKAGVFEMPNEVQGPARDLLSKMLEKDPERRITMPEILLHPFFLSKEPRVIPGRPLVAPPSLDEVDCPVSNASEVDPDIMGNLKTLWHGASDEDITKALLSKEKTWEKAIYHLLIKYRTKHLENYNVDEEEQAANAAKQAGRKHGTRHGGAPEVLADRPAPNAPAATVSPVKSIKPSPPPSPLARPSAPTPTKAAAAGTLGPSLSQRVTKLNAQRTAPAGPRPPLSPRPSSLSTPSATTTPIMMSRESFTPSITVQQATPSSLRIPVPVIDRLSGDTEALSFIPPQSPQLPQESPTGRFFDDVADQLKLMDLRASYASSSTAPRSTPTIYEGDLGRFADADDDETDLADGLSIHSQARSVETYHSRPPSVALGVASQPLQARPSLTEHSQRYPSSYGSNASQGLRSPVEQENRTPAIQQQRFPVGQAQRPAPAPPSSLLGNRKSAPSKITTTVKPLGESSLGRDNSYVYIDMEPASPNPSWNDSQASKQSGSSTISKWADTTMLRKRKPSAIVPTPFSPDLSGNSSNTSPKRSWFQNLFNFKPVPYTLWSHESISGTSFAIQRQLQGLGVKMTVERTEGLTVLRCRYSETREQGGKSVMFKVEILRAAPPSIFATGVNMSLAKGAQSTFKELYALLRRDYKLDGAHSGTLSSPISAQTPVY